MTFYITDLMSLHDLTDMVNEGYVNAQSHPYLPLSIYNYTAMAMVHNVWNDATEHCRGLIVENGTGRIVARGPKKFWNYGQKPANDYPLHTDVLVTKKEDGSIGIAWEYKGHYGVATRGSFTSDQAEHATKKINTNEYKWLREAVGWGGDILTPIVEIVYPLNRIVLDYGDRDELIPLGEVSPEGLICARGITGHKLMADADCMTLGEALALPIPDDEEGYVLDILGMEGVVVEHQKLKGEEYLRKHRIVSKLSERSVWEAWMNGTYEKMLQDIPDEFHEWCGLVKESLTLRKNTIILEAATEFKKIEHLAEDRRSFAQEAKRVYPKRTNLLFLLLDGSIDKLHDSVMKSLKPKFDDPIVKNTEG